MSLKQLKEEIIGAILADFEKVEGVAEKVGEELVAILTKHKDEATTETEQTAGSDAQVVSQASIDEKTAELDSAKESAHNAANAADAAEQERDALQQKLNDANAKIEDATSGVHPDTARAQQALAAEQDAHAATKAELDVTLQKLEHAENVASAVTMDADGARERAANARAAQGDDALHVDGKIVTAVPADQVVEGATVRPTGTVAQPAGETVNGIVQQPKPADPEPDADPQSTEDENQQKLDLDADKQ